MRGRVSGDRGKRTHRHLDGGLPPGRGLKNLKESKTEMRSEVKGSSEVDTNVFLRAMRRGEALPRKLNSGRPKTG